MSDRDQGEDVSTWRLRDAVTETPDHATMAFGPAGGLAQSWDAVPLAGEDAPPPADPSAALLETVRAPGTGAVTVPADGTLGGTVDATDTPTLEWRPDDVTETSRTTPIAAHTDPAAPIGDGLLRFGPGVPAPGTERAAAVWHGTAPPPGPRPPRRRRTGYVLVALVLLAVIGLLLWQRFAPRLEVTAVSVAAARPTVTCDGTELVTATVHTRGAGTLRYHWVRNDGTDSGPLTVKVTRDEGTVRLPLRWTFHGHGSYRATATLAVQDPARHDTPVSFTYACPR